MDTPVVLLNLAIALAVGMLVGLQREKAGSELAGVRTFPLLTMLGAMLVMVSQRLFPGEAGGAAWPTAVVLAAGLVAMALVVLTGNLIRPGVLHPGAVHDREPHGLTTEVAILVMFVVGAMIGAGMRAEGVAVGAGTAVLLYLKPSLRRFTSALSDDDVRAIMQFAAISLIVLPVVPDRAMGPFSAINPYKLWLMVVLVTGVSLSGYVALRIFGPRAGLTLGGLLGGLVSSTATTVSYARLARTSPTLTRSCAAAIAIACAVMGARMLVLVWLVARERAGELLPELGAFLLALVLPALIGAAFSHTTRHTDVAEPEAQGEARNPTELKTALVFAAIYAIVLVLMTWGKETLGNAGMFTIAALSGVADMDAITLSSAGLVARGQLGVSVAVRAILIAAVVNTLFKLAMAWSIGGSRLGRQIAWYFAAPLAVGALLASGLVHLGA
jgi:uncharacterized membrane protein (DUF4010 family)